MTKNNLEAIKLLKNETRLLGSGWQIKTWVILIKSWHQKQTHKTS